MRHHIIVKWKDDAETPDIKEIATLFDDALALPGIYSVSLHPNVIDRPNRYDLLILLCMEHGALPAFDASAVHREWKERYGERIALKTIFDCE